MKAAETMKDPALEEMERILASPGFSRNERLSGFLRYVVQQKLQGKADQLKEAVIGVEVFGRKPDYDPRKDPVVRMEAAKLRSRLAEYYAGFGAADPIRIELPKGAYIPQWQAASKTSSRWIWSAAALTLAALFAIPLALNVGGLRHRLLGRAAAPRIESVAVLPLQNLSHDPEQEYFADGVIEALITALGKLGALRVISRTSVMHYKGTHETLPQIGRELKADAIVEGAVLRSGNRVRITAQLIEAATDRHLWAETYEGDLRDVLVLQGEVARAVANEVEVKLSPQQQTRLAGAQPVNTEAQEAYLRGRFEWNKWTKEGLERSIGYFELALQKDPGNAQAWAGLADAYDLLGIFGIWPTRAAFAKSKAAALKAVELDDTLSEAHVSLGSHSFTLGGSWSGAERELQRAISLDPNNAMARQWYGYHLMAQGRLDESVAEMKRALELDPLSPNKQNSLAVALFRAAHYDEALEHFRATPDPDENSEPRHRNMAAIYERKGMQKEAMAELLTALRLGGKSSLAVSAEQKYLSSGYLEAKKTLLRAEIEEKRREPTGRSLPAVLIAADYVELGEQSKAFEWLDKAFHDAEVGLMYLKVDERFESLRSDPRFQDLLHRIGLSPYRSAD